MTYHAHQLTQQEHGFLLQQERLDPFEERVFKVGDRVVVCGKDHKVFLESTWCAMDGTCICGASETLAHLLHLAEAKPLGKTSTKPDDTIYVHRPHVAPPEIDLTRGDVAAPFPFRVILIALISALLLAVCIFFYAQLRASEKKLEAQKIAQERAQEEQLARERKKAAQREAEVKKALEEEKARRIEAEKKQAQRQAKLDDLSILEQQDKPQQPKAWEEHPSPSNAPDPRFLFRNELGERALGDYADSFIRKNVKEIALYLSFPETGRMAGQLDVRFFEPGGKPILTGSFNSYLQRWLEPNQMSKGLRIPLRLNTPSWPLGTYRVEAWWTQHSADPVRLGQETFEIKW